MGSQDSEIRTHVPGHLPRPRLSRLPAPSGRAPRPPDRSVHVEAVLGHGHGRVRETPRLAAPSRAAGLCLPEPAHVPERSRALLVLRGGAGSDTRPYRLLVVRMWRRSYDVRDRSRSLRARGDAVSASAAISVEPGRHPPRGRVRPSRFELEVDVGWGRGLATFKRVSAAFPPRGGGPALARRGHAPPAELRPRRGPRSRTRPVVPNESPWTRSLARPAVLDATLHAGRKRHGAL